MNVPEIKVKCGVDNCHYWDSSYCTASTLEVNPMFDSDAETSDDTCCTTFKPTD